MIFSPTLFLSILLNSCTVLYKFELTVILNMLHTLVLSSTLVLSLCVLDQVGLWDNTASA